LHQLLKTIVGGIKHVFDIERLIALFWIVIAATGLLPRRFFSQFGLAEARE
jgi:hypothetical protein